MSYEPDCFHKEHIFERCDCRDRSCTASVCVMCGYSVGGDRDALVIRFMEKVTDAIDLIKVSDCSEGADEHELSTYPASLAILTLLAQAEASRVLDLESMKEAIARAIWESDDTNTSPWNDAREVILTRDITYAAADAVISVLQQTLLAGDQA